MRPRPDITWREVRWAREHDWFVSSHALNGTNGLYRIVGRDETSTMGIRYFESFQELRAWAGY